MMMFMPLLVFRTFSIHQFSDVKCFRNSQKPTLPNLLNLSQGMATFIFSFYIRKLGEKETRREAASEVTPYPGMGKCMCSFCLL